MLVQRLRGKVAVLRLPPPLHVGAIRPPVEVAVLVAADERARVAGVARLLGSVYPSECGNRGECGGRAGQGVWGADGKTGTAEL